MAFTCTDHSNYAWRDSEEAPSFTYENLDLAAQDLDYFYIEQFFMAPDLDTESFLASLPDDAVDFAPILTSNKCSFEAIDPAHEEIAIVFSNIRQEMDGESASPHL